MSKLKGEGASLSAGNVAQGDSTAAGERRVSAGDGVALLVIEQRASRAALSLPIVFLPGWVSHRSVWTEFVGRISTSASIYHVEGRDKESALLPAGRNPPRMDVAQQAEDLARVIDAMGLGPRGFHLVGSSTGSNVILEYMASTGGGARPPAAVVLMIPVRSFRIPTWARPLLALPSSVITALKPLIKMYVRLALSDRSGARAMLRYNFASIDRLEPRRTRLSALALLRYAFPSADRLSGIAAAALVVTASLDRMHDPRLGAEIASSIPRCTNVDVGESGRVHSAWMADRVIEFLAGVERGGDRRSHGGAGTATEAGASARSRGLRSGPRARSTGGSPRG